MFKDAEIEIRDEHESWTTVPVPRGTDFRGILAGPIRRVYCHHDGTSSKPCRFRITEGAVPCFCQKERTKGRVYGYAPFVCKDASKCVVMLSATTTTKMKGWKHGAATKLTRPNREKAALIPSMLLPEEMGTQLHKRIAAGAPADISWYLLSILWHDEVLVRHFYKKDMDHYSPKYPPLLKRGVPTLADPIHQMDEIPA